MAAATEVFATYELLEEILMHLPLRALLLAQRVSTGFHDLIWRYERINQALCFNPATGESVRWHRPKDTQPRRENPFQGKWMRNEDSEECVVMLNPFMPIIKTSPTLAVWNAEWWEWKRWSDYEDLRSDTETHGNGILGSSEELGFSTPPRRFFCDYWDEADDDRDDKESHHFFNELHRRWADLITSSEASCKDMLLTYPPCNGVRLINDKRYKLSDTYEKEDVHVDEEGAGVRFGEFVASAAMLSAPQRLYTDRREDYEMDSTTVEVVGGELWELCPKLVDAMTGWEMLRLFDIGIERFRAEMPKATGECA